MKIYTLHKQEEIFNFRTKKLEELFGVTQTNRGF